jgi:predicted nucleic acid-binding protein
MFLIDTVTLSELRRRRRDPVVVAWFETHRTTDLFLSVVSIGEIERGIARLIQALPARLRPGWTGFWPSMASGSCRSTCERRDVGAP